jgi:hypothetical protein
MKVLVTLDHYDGSQSKAVEINSEDFPVREMMFKMMSRDVCGFTVTKLDGLKRLSKKIVQPAAP